MHKLMRYIKGYEKQALLAPLFKMLEACFELFVPLVIASIIDTGIKNEDAAFIWTRCGLLVLLAAIGLASSLTAQWFSAKAALGFGTALRKDLFRHIGTLSYSELDGIGTPTLVTRMTSDINQVQNGVNLTLRLLLRSPFIVIGALIMAFSISPKLTLLFIGVTIMVSLIIWAIMRVTVPIYHEAQNGLDRVTLLTRENYVGARVVRAFARQADELAAFVETNDHLKKLQFAAGRISALMNPLTYVLINLAIVALLYVGSIEINVGGMASGDVIALVNYMNQILVELVKLANLIVQISKALACAGRVQAVLDTKPGMTFPAKLLGEVPADKTGDAVRFDHVGLTYAGAGAPSLTDISFTAKKGQTIGVIGGTGSAKTSLVQLLPRLYDTTAGHVYIGGVDVRDYDLEVLRNSVAMVLQKNELFSGTIAENLRWGNKDATDAEIEEACKQACVDEFIERFPDKYNTHIDQGGTNVSGGQKQRLCIARALLKKPRILILDDSTSAVDTGTDAKIRKSFAEKIPGTTVFIIAQRISSVENADHVIVLDNGRISGYGTPAEMLATNPIYQEVYNSQTKGSGDFDEKGGEA